ncbi:MAG: hypothetical protein LBJ84_00540 [Oscillospiraceae bacterium]|nr:hypothetical protein [Oscillospiraceae bacterium]
MKTKKLLSALLIACLALSLFACGGNSDDNSPPASPPASDSPSASPEPSPETPATTPEGPTSAPSDDGPGDDPINKVGFYDPDYDYNANPKYKFIYVCIGFNDLNGTANQAFEHWATLANVQYDGYWSATSNEELLTQLPTLKEQGYDGILIDPDMMQYEQIAEICDRIGLNWMGCMGQAFKWDENGMPAGLLHPYSGFSSIEMGRQIGDKLIEYAKDNWAGVTLDQVGFIGVDMSTSLPLHQRIEGSQMAWTDAGGPADNHFIADVGADMTVQAAQNVVESLISLNPELEYWLINGAVEDFADGAANAIDNVFGAPDNACIATSGGNKLSHKWDEGIDSAWRYVLDTPAAVAGEPAFFALYAFASGLATPETIWPAWINHNPPDVPFFGETYAQLLLPSYFQSKETYKRLLTWANLYTRSNIYPYNEPGVTIDDFPARAPVPPYYAG